MTSTGTNRNDSQAHAGQYARSLRAFHLLFLGMLFLPTMGCDSLDKLMAVSLPGEILEETANDPSLAEWFVLGVQAEFECALQGHLHIADGLWAGTYHVNNNILEQVQYESRSSTVRWLSNGGCTDVREGVWRPMHAARGAAESVRLRLTEGLPQGSIPEPDLNTWIALTDVYEGYSTQLLGEVFCGVIFGGDEQILTRAETFLRAENLFTSAIDYASRVTTGTRAQEAQELLNLALVGRARARLNLGNGSGAVQDAERVPEGFVRYATYDLGVNRRTNPMNYLQAQHTIHMNYRNLEVDGVPDPRVPVMNTGQTGVAGLQRWVQLKYADQGSDIPFASWREAQLMIAEVEGGQRAVNIINQLRSTWNLPLFSSANEAEIRAQVLEERRRELFLQGTKMGDDLRTGLYETWSTGNTPVGRPIAADETCMPVPEVEFF